MSDGVILDVLFAVFVLFNFRGTIVKDTDYHWVLTVPAIWEDAAKQFMREAAEKVGSFLFLPNISVKLI